MNEGHTQTPEIEAILAEITREPSTASPENAGFWYEKSGEKGRGYDSSIIRLVRNQAEAYAAGDPAMQAILARAHAMRSHIKLNDSQLAGYYDHHKDEIHFSGLGTNTADTRRAYEKLWQTPVAASLLHQIYGDSALAGSAQYNDLFIECLTHLNQQNPLTSLSPGIQNTTWWTTWMKSDRYGKDLLMNMEALEKLGLKPPVILK